MNEYKITLKAIYSHGHSEYALTRNADNKLEALQSFMDDFEYNDLSEYDEDLEIIIKVTKI